jgi:uncharacterized protein YlxP (DUF503 family)
LTVPPTRAILSHLGATHCASRHYASRFTYHVSRITFYAMLIGACSVELHLPGNGSLKGKRSILKPLLIHLRREFNLAAAEVAHHDVWQSAEVALVTVANDPGHVHAVLERAVRWIETHHPEVQVVDWQIEIL